MGFSFLDIVLTFDVERESRQRETQANLVCPRRISDYLPNPTQFDMTNSSANDLAALPPPGITFTTLDNGLVVIVRRKIFS